MTQGSDKKTNIGVNIASRAMRLKYFANREVSERRQVGDAEELVNAPPIDDSETGGKTRWWRNVGMADGL